MMSSFKYRSFITMGRLELRKSPESDRWSMVKPRPAVPTAKFIDEYCEWYRDLFPEVRSTEGARTQLSCA
jgi:hypothetical protein